MDPIRRGPSRFAGLLRPVARLEVEAEIQRRLDGLGYRGDFKEIA
jgi:hypothetical protein